MIKSLIPAAAAVFAAAPLAAQAPPAAPAPASASAPQPAAGEEIIVRGETESERRKLILRYAKALTDAVPSSAIALYQPDDYCPAVVGLSPSINAAITARMRQVSDVAGIGAAKTPCATSALVLFVDSVEATLKALASEHPEYMSEINGEDILYWGRGTPVIAWKINARIDRDGNPVAVTMGPESIQVVESRMGSSRLEASSTVVIAMSVLLVERPTVSGLTTQQIADYALMRSVSEVDPATLAGQPVDTILKVIDAKPGEQTPLSLTDWDLAYVKARYSLNRLNLGGRQFADIRLKMRRSLDAAPLKKVSAQP